MGNAQGGGYDGEKRHSQRGRPSYGSDHDSSYQIGGSGRSQPRSIHSALVRQRDKKSDFSDFYEIIEEIGQGGLCKIYKIRKKQDMIGGSSREGNVRGRRKSFFSSNKNHHRRKSSTLPLNNIFPVYSEPSVRTMTGNNTPGTPRRKSTRVDPKGGHGSPAMMAHAESEPSLRAPRTTGKNTTPEVEGADDHDFSMDDNDSESSVPGGVVAIPKGLPLRSKSAGSSGGPRRSKHLDSLDSSDDGTGGGYFGTPGRHASTGGSTNMYFALKEINLAMVKEDKIDQLRNEVEIVKALDHQNIIKAYETFHSKQTKKLMIVMELCTGGDLHSRLPYKEHRAARIVRQILSAVSYCHEKNIIHRDLKLENVMFENDHPDSIIKLIDFGVSKVYNQKDSILSERVGTLYSMSPETMMGDYEYKADMWSMGVCTYMLLSGGQQPFTGKTPKQMVAKVLVGRYNFDGNGWSSISDEAKDFIRHLLVVKPEGRMSVAEAKQHAWMKMHNADNYAREQSGDVIDEAFKQRVRACIVRYAQSGEFLKLALNVIAKKSSAEDIFELRSVFDEFDTEHTGTLTLKEFKAALGQFKYSEEDIEEVFRKIDVNRNNEVNYTEFLAAALETQGNIQEYRLAEAFDLMDSDDSGYISRDNLRQLVGNHVDDRYIDQLLAEADFFNDGKISYTEFLQAFNKRNQELVYNMYELEQDETEESNNAYDSDEEILRRFGIIKSIRKVFNSSGSLSARARANSEKSR